VTSEELYIKLSEKANKNATNDNIAYDKPRLKFAINEAQNRFLEGILDRRNEDEIRYVQKFLVDSKLKEEKVTDDSCYYLIPTNFFDLANVHAIAKSGSCKDKIKLWEVKSENVHEYLYDQYNKPSFYYRESFYYLTKDSIRVFKDDFTLDTLMLSYYRYPKEIDFEGYVDVNGNHSSAISPEWDDKSMDRIITLAVKNLNISMENFNAAQINQQQINSKL